MLGIASLVIGIPALVFAVFGWAQAPVPFGDAFRYVCLLGSLGAVVSGSLLLQESILIRKAVVQPVKQAALDFLVMMEYEGEQKN